MGFFPFIASNCFFQSNFQFVVVWFNVDAKCCSIVVVEIKKAFSFSLKALILLVVWEGIEPPTQGFSVLCSTN